MISYPIRINGVDVHAQYTEQAVRAIFLPLLQKLTDMQKEKNGRILVFLAAPPGAGKSTLVSFLEHLSREHEGLCPLQGIGMDGFHRRQSDLLSATTLRDGKHISLVEIKGAPMTFDLPHLTGRIREIASGAVCGWPVYDRLLHNPVEDAVQVRAKIVLLEGNYLLLREEGWDRLSEYADYTISVHADEAMLRTRLIERRIQTGVARDAAVRFVDFSDMPNVRLCLQKTKPVDLCLRIDENNDYHVEPAPV